ncbi:hypothetical protein GGI35DRAFT_458621 [Trichoderma velutinum]
MGSPLQTPFHRPHPFKPKQGTYTRHHAKLGTPPLTKARPCHVFGCQRWSSRKPCWQLEMISTEFHVRSTEYCLCQTMNCHLDPLGRVSFFPFNSRMQDSALVGRAAYLRCEPPGRRDGQCCEVPI